MKEIKSLNISQCWRMVNRIKNIDNAETAILWLDKASITCDEHNDLMDAVASLERELYKIPSHSFC